MPPIYPPADSSFSFRGKTVWLEPAGEQHRETMRTLARNEAIWEFTKTLLLNDTFDQQFDQYFNDALKLATIGEQAFIIHTVADDTIIGMTRLFDVDWNFRHLEIGYTWYDPSVWGKVHNKECKLILLQYAFEQLHFVRVQFRIVGQNIRSQKAVAKIGGEKEGVIRKTGLRNDGSWRDTVYFSILDDEWPEKKERLLRLAQV